MKAIIDIDGPDTRDVVDGIVEMSEKMAQKRSHRRAMDRHAIDDLAQDMRVNALRAWISWDHEKGDWWARCKWVMDMTGRDRVASALTIPPKPAKAALRAKAMHGDDRHAVEAEIRENGFGAQAARNIAANLDKPWLLRRELEPGYEDREFQIVEIRDQLMAFDQLLNERQQMIWHFLLNGKTGTWIADCVGVHKMSVSREISELKCLWLEFSHD